MINTNLSFSLDYYPYTNNIVPPFLYSTTNPTITELNKTSTNGLIDSILYCNSSNYNLSFTNPIFSTFTLECTVQTNINDSIQRILFGSRSQIGATGGCQFIVLLNGTLQFGYSESSAGVFTGLLNTSKIIADNFFHHIVVTGALGSKLTIYLDSVLVYTSPNNYDSYYTNSSTGTFIISQGNFKMNRYYNTNFLGNFVIENYLNIYPLNPSNLFISDQNVWYWTYPKMGGA